MSHAEAFDQSKRDSSFNGISHATVWKSPYRHRQHNGYGSTFTTKHILPRLRKNKINFCVTIPGSSLSDDLLHVGRPGLDSWRGDGVYLFANAVSRLALSLSPETA
jgi:hypothetical protein